jgi:ATP-dependent DNA ligase
MEKNTQPITDVLQAIATDVIKGNFTDDKTTFIFPIIKNTNKLGNVSTWQISVKVYNTKSETYTKFTKKIMTNGMRDYNTDLVGVIHVDNITHTGKTRKCDDTTITEGKNIGKTTETNPVTQAIVRAHSLYKDKYKKTSTNIPNEIIVPMLLKDIKDITISDDEYSRGVILERKYDGIRAVTYFNGESIVMYSRSGMKYEGFSAIEEELLQLFKGETNVYLDGELYLHGYSLQDISGAVRGVGRFDRHTLSYIVFDCFTTNDNGLVPQGALDRKKMLNKMFANRPFKHIENIQWNIITEAEQVDTYLNTYLQEGYEGAILRRIDLPYEESKNNYHSSNILKVKPHCTAEFTIVGYTQGTHGKDVGALIITCEVNGKEFNAVPKDMTYVERYHLYKRFTQPYTNDTTNIFEKYIHGQLATIQYSILSKLGVPQQPKFINVRTESEDIISILLKELHSTTQVVV